MKSFDFVVIGAGSAGYAAARTASQLGAKVALIDGAKQLSGLCILRGCMPTKALLESSHRLNEIKHATEFGLRGKPYRPDWPAILKRKNRLIKEFADYRIQQLKQGPFHLFRGKAYFLNPYQLQVTSASSTETIAFKKALITTGSILNQISFPGLERAGYLTSDSALDIKKPIKSLAILGGGAVAVEFAQHFSRLGTQVTLIQRSPHLLHDLDDDLTEVLENVFRKEGIQLITNTQLIRFDQHRNKKRIFFHHHHSRHISPIKSIQAEQILYALGRRPNLEKLGLENLSLFLKNGRLKVNAKMQTQLPHIYVAGDASGLYEIVHMAVQQAEIAAKNAVGNRNERWSTRLKTSVLYTDPQIAVTGSSEKDLRLNQTPYLVARYFFKDHGKALIHGATDGFVKLLCHPQNGRIFGGAIIGPQASELIHEIIAVMNYRGTVQQLAALPHYHPTLAEIITYPAEELALKIKKKKS